MKLIEQHSQIDQSHANLDEEPSIEGYKNLSGNEEFFKCTYLFMFYEVYIFCHLILFVKVDPPPKDGETEYICLIAKCRYNQMPDLPSIFYAKRFR